MKQFFSRNNNKKKKGKIQFTGMNHESELCAYVYLCVMEYWQLSDMLVMQILLEVHILWIAEKFFIKIDRTQNNITVKLIDAEFIHIVWRQQ